MNLHSTWLGKFSGKTKNFQPYGQKNCEEIFSCYLITTQQFFFLYCFGIAMIQLIYTNLLIIYKWMEKTIATYGFDTLLRDRFLII